MLNKKKCKLQKILKVYFIYVKFKNITIYGCYIHNKVEKHREYNTHQHQDNVYSWGGKWQIEDIDVSVTFHFLGNKTRTWKSREQNINIYLIFVFQHYHIYRCLSDCLLYSCVFVPLYIVFNSFIVKKKKDPNHLVKD